VAESPEAAARGRLLGVPYGVGSTVRRAEVECACEATDERPLYELLKRSLDVGVALLALLAVAPLLALVAAAVKLQDGGPVLFRQLRVGRRGRVFCCPKLRSMRVTAEGELASLVGLNQHAGGVVFKMARDPRVTPLGRWLRKYSIDELPQLWSVLRGDMSLVGPRPPLIAEVERYRGDQLRRLQVRPGLTCLWQVQGRANLDFERQVELDLAYIDQRGLLLDAHILLQTLPAVVLARGAY
jgi:lipopolysaccharide/colanic/teichoic acid biosynthesis glycosyltransferase